MKWTSGFLLLWACFAIVNCDEQSPNPRRQTIYGDVEGITLLANNGRPYDAFLGIPYAKPPVGDLRFAPPQPPEKWNSVLNATKEAPHCIQKNYLFNSKAPIEGKEDCLYLNVYQPQKNSTDLLPVMFYIHWGAFFAGKSDRDYLGPDYLMDKDVIVVTFNYRLGIFGFFSTRNDYAPGNNGMKDQVAALKWVKNNIKNFGGDPDRITISGTSAGAGSVQLHMISPSSRNLFHQAIAGSGNALALWARPLRGIVSNTLNLALDVIFRCWSLGFSNLLVNCLRNVEAEALLNGTDKLRTFSIEPLTVFILVPEMLTEKNPEPFLTKDPIEYIQAGEFANVSLLMSVTKDEGILRASQLLRQSDTRAALNRNFDVLTPEILLLLPLSNVFHQLDLWFDIKSFYLKGKNKINITDPALVQGFIDIYTDRSFVYSAYQSAMLLSAKGLKPIWFYQLSYRGKYTYGDLFASTKENFDFDWGVSHCDDLIYIFKSPALIPELTSAKDLEMRRVLIDFYTNFIIHGEPYSNDIKWDRLRIPDKNHMNNELFSFLNITGKHDSDEEIGFHEQTGFYRERMKFWSSKSLSENFEGLN